MIKPGEIQKIANRLGVRDSQIEKDYVIGWVLKGISNNDYLKEKLIFKGGTAIGKIYISDYRLSEDLDFTYNGDDCDTIKIKTHFEELIQWLKEESRITLNIQDEKIHQTGNYNFYLGYTGPLGAANINRSIKVDVANDELLCNDPVEMKVNNKYSDLNDEFKIMNYTLGEIISEKMRSLMQRTTPRDLYDLWYLFEIEHLDIEDYLIDFKRKIKFKELDPNKLIETIQGKKEIFKRQWENHLVNQIKVVPNFEAVWRTLGKHWRMYDKSIEK